MLGLGLLNYAVGWKKFLHKKNRVEDIHPVFFVVMG